MTMKIPALSLLVGAAALVAASQPAQAKTITLKIANFTSVHSSTSRWFESEKKRIAKESNGKLKLEIFYGSAMGPMPRHYDLARKGVADMAFFQHGVTRGRFPLTELTHAPYLFPSGAKGAIVGAKVGADMLRKYLAAEHKGTKPLWVVFNRASGVYDSKKPIRSISDLKGRKYRAPTPTDVAMMKALGAAPIGMPATHMAESLQKGVIDGVVTDPMGIFAFKLGGMVKYYTPMFVSAISFGLTVNAGVYKKLPGDLRKLVDSMGTKKNAVRMATLSWGEDFPRFVNYMKGAKLVNVPLSKTADAEMRALAAKVIEGRVAALEKRGLPGRKVYGDMKRLSAEYSK